MLNEMKMKAVMKKIIKKNTKKLSHQQEKFIDHIPLHVVAEELCKYALSKNVEDIKIFDNAMKSVEEEYAKLQ